MSWTPVILYRPRTRCNGKTKSNGYRMEVECRGCQSCCSVHVLDHDLDTEGESDRVPQR